MEEQSTYFLQPGYIFLSKKPFLIHTILGSCVAVCIWDSFNKFGGMNHYMYAFKEEHHVSCAKYGNVSIPYLIRAMIDMGSKKEHLNVRLFGGAQNPLLGSFIGKDNVSVAKTILYKYDISVISEDTGGLNGRKIIFDNRTGNVQVYNVQNTKTNDWFSELKTILKP